MDTAIPTDAFVEGRTRLFYASSANEVQSLVNAGASVNVIDSDGMTPFLYAIRNNITNSSVISALIDAGADVNVSDKAKRTALFYAVAFDDTNVAALLIRNAGVDVNRTDSEGKTALFYARSRNMVKCLADAGAKVNETDNEGKTALHCSVTNNNELLYTALIDVGVNVNAQDIEGKTALHYAVIRGTQTFIQLLISSGANINLRDKKGYTTLFYAVEEHRAAVVIDLIDAGADVTITDNLGKTALFYALSRNMVNFLVDSGAEINKTDNERKTALHCAVISNNEFASTALIDVGVNVNAQDIEGRTALHYAVIRETQTFIQLLISSGANINLRDKRGYTALFCAVEQHREAVVAGLIDAGADVTITDNLGKTALFYALSRNMVNFLVDSGAEINKTDNERKTALHCAVISNNEFASTALIDVGVNVNAQDIEGRTALHYAVIRETQTFIQLLISSGANINLRDKRGYTALFCAVEQHREAVVAGLIDAGADVTITDNLGKTALFYALSRNMVNFLVDSGAEINKTDNERKTALHCAVISNNEFASTALIDVGVNVNAQDIEGRTALHYAVIRETQTFIQLLISSGANINLRDKRGYTALFCAVEQHREAVVAGLIDAGADVTITDNEGKTALFHAVDNTSLVCELVENGKAEVHVRDIYGRTPLFYAFTKSLEVARCLLAKGALLRIKDNCHLSILSFYIHSHFCHLGRPSILKGIDLIMSHEILQEGVFQAIIDTVFCRILSSISAFSSISEALQFAIENIDFEYQRHGIGKIIETVNKETNENKDLVKRWESLAPKMLNELGELGAKPNSVDSDGNTALHYATRLPYIGISQTTVMTICMLLRDLGVSFNVKNQQYETPLLFCLSGEAYDMASYQQKLPAIQTVVKVCKFLIENGASVEETSRAGESVFHLILKISRHSLSIFHVEIGKSISKEAEKLLELIAQARIINGFTVNRRNTNLIAPLHLWASLEYNALAVDPIYANVTTPKDDTLEKYLQRIFHLLLKCGAKVDERNVDNETPLHLSRSWTASKLLLDAGANPNDLDSLGRTPLLVAAQNIRFLRTPDRLYPDVSLEPKAFWNLVLDKGLDQWAVDKNGESVMSVLVNSEAFALARALLEVACEENVIQSQSIAASLLNAVCKDESPRALWKSILVEKILKSSKSYLLGKENQDTPLHLCCRNIVRAPERTSAHWTIAEQLLSVGADCRIADASGLSCLDIAKSCPELQELLLKPAVQVVQLLIPWTSVSTTYQLQLAKVARRQECEQVGQFWYHRCHLASGSFGFVFAGIHEKDGREVAIKRIEKLRLQRPEDKREISNLTALADCEQVVRYLSFYDDDHFSYVVLELMEGNLEEYFDSCIFDLQILTGLCLDVVTGLRYLHDRDVLHRDLKPSNILYKTHPKLCLKIADFGLSLCVDSTGSISVYSTNVGTKCWIAPEVLKSSKDCSKPSDIFSCGLLLHYILAVKKHPFAAFTIEEGPKFSLLQTHETQSNVINNKMEGWDDSICPEARNLVKKMLDAQLSRRPTAEDTSEHPLFWTKKKKIDLLTSVANQPEFECPRAKRSLPLTAVETDLETTFSTIVVHPTWDDPAYLHMPAIYAEMMKKRRTPYNTFSIIELVRFIRNAISHVSEDKRPTPIRKQLLEDFVFLEYFPNLVIEVFEAVTKHGWDQTREEIKYAMNK